jgi:transposase
MRSHNVKLYQMALAMNRNRTTISAFLKRYDQQHMLSAKRGRPRREIPPEERETLLSELEQDRRLSLRSQIRETTRSRGLSHARMALWDIRHDAQLHFYSSTPVTPLDPAHMDARLQFCNQMAQLDPRIPIIFTDESTVKQDLNKGGLWRRRGEHIDQEFFDRPAHPVQVMIWGGIGPNGYRTTLIRCPKSVNKASYVEFLSEYNIITDLDETFGRGQYLFQQDNATAHTATRDCLSHFTNILQWPAKSPDLSPIEQVWALIKPRIAGRKFRNADDLFDALTAEWIAIPDSIIANLHSAFPARCAICAKHNGASLNGHWSEVHRLHHPEQFPGNGQTT